MSRNPFAEKGPSLPSYELIRSRRRTISAEIGEGGRVIVRAPLRMPKRDIDYFVEDHAAWIAAHSAARAARGLVRGGIDPDEVGTVLLAGSFGRYISPVSAAAIGLLPPGWSDEATAVGNAALEGADRWLSSDECRDGIERISGSTIVVDLNSSPAFREAFLGGLDF